MHFGATAFCKAVRTAPAATTVAPGPRHWTIFVDLCRRTRARANLVPDAYLAALEHGATFVNERPRVRPLPGLAHVDPLTPL